MPTVVQMREALLNAYSGPDWPSKVKKMSDSQVFVIYTRLKASGKV